MPLNVRRFCTSILLVFVGFVGFIKAQDVVPPAQTVTPPAVPTAGDVMRDRISKAKAFIVVRNYNAAIYELENIRRESADTVLLGVVNVLLMNSYLEQGDYKRAQDLLGEFYKAQKTTKPNAAASYMAVAGQIVKGARNRVERYRALGLSITDRTLPLEALNDLEKMRETLELVITEAKEMGADKAKTADAMALLEEASNSRSMLARDDYDGRRWKDEVADTREQITNSRSVVLSAVGDAPAETALLAQNTGAAQNPVMMQNAGLTMSPGATQNTPEIKSNSTREREAKPVEKTPAETNLATNDKPVYVPSAPPTVKEQPKAEAPKTIAATDGTPIDVGSLIAYATRQAQPIYPAAAKSIRATGVVKVEVTVNENGDVSDVQKTSGPTLLQGAAKDAIRKWKFKPFVRDGQPVRATGFINFSFNL